MDFDVVSDFLGLYFGRIMEMDDGIGVERAFIFLEERDVIANLA